MGQSNLAPPFDGVVVERNLAVDEMVVDNTVNLFQIADVNRLLVVANCPEEVLPALEALDQRERKWTVQTMSTPSGTGLPGTIDEIGQIFNPNQHTAIIKGYVENPGQHIRTGQYVSVTVKIPPPDDVVEIPADALIDDGKQTLVLVQPDPAGHQVTSRRVEVKRRLDGKVLVRSSPIPKKEQLTAAEAEQGLLPREPLRGRARPGAWCAGIGRKSAQCRGAEARSSPRSTGRTEPSRGNESGPPRAGCAK